MSSLVKNKGKITLLGIRVLVLLAIFGVSASCNDKTEMIREVEVEKIVEVEKSYEPLIIYSGKNHSPRFNLY